MSKGLQGIVAATCLAIIAALSWWGWISFQDYRERGKQAAVDEVMRQADVEVMRQQCRDMIAAWDRGDVATVEKAFGAGQNAAGRVTICRTYLSN